MKKKFTFLMTAMALIFAMMGSREAWGEEKTLIIDGSQLTSTATTSATDKTYDGFTITFSDGAKQQSSTGDNRFTDKAILIGKSGKYIYNKTPIPGKITKFEIYANKGASAKVSVGVYFSTTAITGYATGTNTYTATLSTLDNVYDCSSKLPDGAKYFWYQVTNANNSQVQFRITYEDGTTPTVAAPTFNPAAGTYYEDKTIELSAEEGCTIHYTLDGTTPAAESTEYSTPIQLTVPSTTTIKAIAVDGEGNSSNVASATYTLKRSQYTPAQLLAVEPDDQQYTVVFNSETITEFYFYNSQKRGFYIEAGEEDFLTYCSGTPTDWEIGGKVSGTVTGTWKTYSNLKEFCPTNYDDFSYTPPTQQLPEPTGLTVSNLSMTGATLSWNAVEHASSYTVYVTDANEYEETYTNITENSKVLNDLTAGTEYMWTVKAIGDGVTYLNSEIAEGEVFETPTTVLYTVNFEHQQTGGTIEFHPEQAVAGEEVVAIATAADHYSFTQWNFSPEVTILADGEITDYNIIFIMPASDVTVSATFTEEAKYTVTYAKGGDDVTGEDPETVSYYEDDVVTLEENPYTRTGYTFYIWEVKYADITDYLYENQEFEMPASNVTVTAFWDEKDQYTVTYKSLGETIATEQVYDGDLCANVPTVSNIPTGWTFFGWTTGSANQTTTAPEPFDPTTDPVIEDIMLNAVFTKTEGETSWDETELADLTSSDVFVMVGNDRYAVKNAESTNKGPAPVEVTINEQTVVEPTDEIKWTLTGNDTDGYTFYSNANNSNYLYCSTTASSGSNDNLRVGKSGDRKYFVLSENHLKTKDNSTARYIGINGTSDFRGYTSSSTNSVTFKFYKLNTGTTYYTTVAPASEYAIAIDENIQHGTIEVENALTAAEAGTEITLIVTPAEHYSLTPNSLTVTGESSATVEVTPVPGEVIKYTFVMPAEAVTITAQFTENPKFTVSCYANGTLVSKEQVYAGEMQLTAPDNVPNGFTYVGYATEEISGVAGSATYFSSYDVTRNVDLYAVFAIAEGGGTTSVTKDIIAEAGVTASVTLNATAYPIGNLPIQLTATKGTTNWPVINYNPTYGNDLRFYKASSSVTFSTTNNQSITKIEFKKNESTASDLKTYFSVNVGTLSANVWTGSANSVTISFSNSDNFKEQMYIINVTYSETSAPTYSNFCTTITALSGNLAEVPTVANTAYYINGESTVEGKVTINGVLGNADASLLIIEDGGQLILNEKNIGVMATVKKQIEASNTPTGEPVDKWYTIGSPVKEPIINGSTGNYVADIIPADGMSALTYDLYYLDMTAGTWINYRQEGGTPGFTTLENGRGYIYSNQSATTVKYVGELNTANVNRSVNTGWNLVSNPFAQTIAFSNFELDNSALMVGYYSLDGAGGWQAEPITTVVASNTGILVNVPEGASSIVISKPAEAIENNGAKRGDSNDNAYAYIEINVANANYSDRAYAAFAEGYGLPKYDHINAEIQKVYIPQDGEDFAIAMMDENVTLFPLNFKAMTTGYYTISLKSSQIYEGYNDFDYLHLIDNMTGEEIDMLMEDGYKFAASPKDNAGRFTVKLHRNGIEENDIEDANFVYQNGNELVINGEGTFQLIDMLGRVVISKEVHGETVRVDNLITGAYIVRMIGNEVKTQKIVIK